MATEPVIQLDREMKPASHGVGALKDTIDNLLTGMGQLREGLALLADEQANVREHVVQWQATQATNMEPLHQAVHSLLTLATDPTVATTPWYRRWVIGLLAGHLCVGLLGGYLLATSTTGVPREVPLMKAVNALLVKQRQALPKPLLQDLDSLYKEHRFEKLSTQKEGK